MEEELKIQINEQLAKNNALKKEIEMIESKIKEHNMSINEAKIILKGIKKES